jgi:hypothetical protein
MDFLLGIPELAEVMKAKVEALSGDDIETSALRIAKMFDAIRTVRGMNSSDVMPHAPLPPTQ